jgi:hypothetical protein
MNLTSLRWLTWGTIAGSVASALLLAAGDSGLATNGERRVPAALRANEAGRAPLALPDEPTRAGALREVPAASGASR